MVDIDFYALVTVQSDRPTKPKGSLVRVAPVRDCHHWTADEMELAFFRGDETLPRWDDVPASLQETVEGRLKEYNAALDGTSRFDNAKNARLLGQIDLLKTHGYCTHFTPREMRKFGIAVITADERRFDNVRLSSDFQTFPKRSTDDQEIRPPKWGLAIDYEANLSAQSISEWNDQSKFVAIPRSLTGWAEATVMSEAATDEVLTDIARAVEAGEVDDPKRIEVVL